MPGAIVNSVQGKIDVALSQFARGYTNNTMVAELLFPRVDVIHQSDFFWQFGRENQAIRENSLRAPGAAAERIVQTLSKTKYNCVDHSYERLIPDEERANFMAGDVEQWATGALTDKLLLDEEIRAAAAALNAANYAAANVLDLAAGNQWSDFLNGGANLSTPITDVENAKAIIRQMGKNANLLILGDPLYAVLRTHPAIVGRVAYNKIGGINLQDLAAIFDVPQVILASAIQLDLNDTPSFVWGKNAILAYSQPGASMMDPSFGKTFVWAQAPGTVGGFATEMARATPASRKSDEIATHFYYGQQVTSNISAYLFKNAVQ